MLSARKLHLELVAAGLPVIGVSRGADGKVRVDYANANSTQVAKGKKIATGFDWKEIVKEPPGRTVRQELEELRTEIEALKLKAGEAKPRANSRHAGNKVKKRSQAK